MPPQRPRRTDAARGADVNEPAPPIADADRPKRPDRGGDLMDSEPEPTPAGSSVAAWVQLLERARRDADLSVQEAARQAGISSRWWSQVVAGEGPRPTRRTLMAMAIAVDADPAQVLAAAGLPASADELAELREKVWRQKRHLGRAGIARLRELGVWLRGQRTIRRQTLAEAAADAGVATATLGKMEHGEAVRHDKYTAIETAYNLTPGTCTDFLVGRGHLPDSLPAQSQQGTAQATDQNATHAHASRSSGPHDGGGKWVYFIEADGRQLHLASVGGVVLLIPRPSGPHLYDPDTAYALALALIAAVDAVNGSDAKPAGRSSRSGAGGDEHGLPNIEDQDPIV
jgi:transcriptional regulator with XRE-family HTH domain